MHPPPISSGPSARQGHGARGFTAIELMVTIAIVAILAALAAPSFTPLIERWRVRQATEAMRSTIYLARSEAIRRGGGIVVRKNPSVSGVCALADTKQDWGCGWIVFADTDNDKKLDSGEVVLQTYAGPRSVNITHNSGGEYFTVDRNGVVGSLNVKGFTLSPDGPGIKSPASRGLCVSSGGRVRVIEEPPCQ